ncbi:hypothetical protein LTR62_007206 [Meristemomyces frigidus]|uniref:Peptidase M43 pregnancy-associated plasma-A domain-containing protein n=1 Tax=Meristemomyces frigidus TaxID=1508187 RepID=A0AAN7TCF4_9PEZI|nr:hypothetical protein LTR62_007206 [Meristemomyces frigidus]
MKGFFAAAFVALGAVGGVMAQNTSAEHSNSTGSIGQEHGGDHDSDKKPFGNSTHFFDHAAGRIVEHYTAWSNGTHFRESAIGQSIKHFDCDVRHSGASHHFNSTISALHLDHQNSAVGSRAARSLVERSTVSPRIQKIPLYIHVITKVSEQGVITQAMVNAQAATLNKVYNQYGIHFVLQGTTFTANDAWAVAAGSDMDALKQSLRQGSYSTLNLYFHTDLDGGVLGTCTLPSTVPSGSQASEYVADGCNCNAYTMPGSTMQGYNQGMTAVHETGHWLGLLHTFEGYSCSGNGDYISDTPFESVSTNGCPASPWKNSCPAVSKGDPIRNYMDYSIDSCYARFTPGQVQRISTMWTTYRKGN